MKQREQTRGREIPQKYSIGIKKHIVERIERGELSKEEARRHYRIAGKSTVLNWCRKYGTLQNIGLRNEIMLMTEETKNKALERRIEQLEKQLKDAELKAYVFEVMIDMSEKEFGIEIKKNAGMELLKQSRKPNKRHR